MLTGLFARQREQHPIIYCIGDVVLDSEFYEARVVTKVVTLLTAALKFQMAYERYVKVHLVCIRRFLQAHFDARLALSHSGGSSSHGAAAQSPIRRIHLPTVR